jgi:hypothetical protein
MKAEQLQLALRPRPPWEAIDLGVRMTQRSSRSLLRAFLPMALLLVVACGATLEIAPWLPSTLLWWFKPWLDRILLHIYARLAFGEQTGFNAAWEARRVSPWGPMLSRLTLTRLAFWRAYSAPVIQLEGLAGAARRQRLATILRSQRGVATVTQSAFSWIELFVTFGLLSLVPWMTPGLRNTDTLRWLFSNTVASTSVLYLAHAASVLLVEPFFVASGFAMYLNRRVELEAWDVEQELRHAFGAR